MQKLYYNTVSELLLKTLEIIMRSKEFKDFRLVGGTALSLQKGHRMSVDIDLLTDAEYGTISFDEIEQFLKQNFSYVDSNSIDIIGFGKSYFVGNNEQESIKLDIYYTDNFIQAPLIVDEIRMATSEEIIAMKIDVISRTGRKKDFWDIHEFINVYSLSKMIDLHKIRYPYSQSDEEIKDKMIDFSSSDEDFDPICLKNKYWEIVKLDLIDFTKTS